MVHMIDDYMYSLRVQSFCLILPLSLKIFKKCDDII